MVGLKIGIDLGTKNTVIFVSGKGIVFSESTVVTFDEDGKKIVSIGNKAEKMLEKNPETLKVVCPLKNGVVSDINVTQKMLTYYIDKICGYKIFKPTVIICTPSTITTLEKKTLLSAIAASGAGRACILEEPLAALLGTGTDISQPGGRLVADIGGGTTDVAVVTMGNVAVSNSVRTAGNALDEAIQRYVRRERDILIGLSTAEELKKTIGCAFLPTEEIAVTCKGKNFFDGMPVSFEITSTEVYLALREQVEAIAEAIRVTLEKTPPELVADIYSNGLVLTGGGGRLYGFGKMLSERLNMNVRLSEKPELCAANGLGYALTHPEFLKKNGYFFITKEQINGYEEDRN